MTAYKITFEDGHLGRSDQGDLDPFVVDDGGKGEDGLVREILRRATPRLLSRDVDVDLNEDLSGGAVLVGAFRVVGRFKVEPVVAEEVTP